MMDAGSPSKTFLGVRFFLFRFDPVTERQVRSKLIDGGGVGVGQYNQSCTHVIVDKKIVYDDPMCVVARGDGKTLVTGLWVDHSYDLGVQVDPLSMMYRPLRNLNGIPGAKCLIMCLTGYQRQDREDIMTMVGLMGAQFSKPLMANKVTHLICYKFEGEKYELAKKMKRIKLVNHRWLEDCLREWELLPEADYNNSGIELDTMEAEVKDSDEEAEEPAVKQSSIRSPRDSKLRMLSATELPKLAMEVPNPTFPEDPVGAKAKEVSPTPGKLNRSSPSSNNAKSPVTLGRQETGASVDVPAKHLECQNSTKIDMNTVSMGKREEKYSPDAKFPAAYSKKTRKKPTLQGFPGEASGNASGSPKAVRPDDSSDFSPKMFQEKGKYGATVSPLKAGSLHHGEDSAHILPQKRQIGVEASARSSKSPKTSLNAASANEKSPDLNVGTKPNASDAKKLSNTDENSTKNDPTCLLNASGNEQNGNAKKSPMSRRKLKESWESKSSVEKLRMRRLSHSVGQPMVLENKELDDKDSSPSGRKAETWEPHSPVELDLVEGAIEKSNVKSSKKKMLAKKTLGSRPKVNNIASRKGSIYSNKISPEDDAAIYFNGDEERAAATGGNIEEASPSTISNVAVGSNADIKAENVDDETEAPDENEKYEFEKTLNEKKSENVDDETKAPDRLMEEARNEPDNNLSEEEARNEPENNLAVEEARNDKDTELGGPTSESASKRKTKQVRKELSVKAKNKAAPAEPENNLAVDEALNGKENGFNLESVVSNNGTKLEGLTSECASKGKTKQVGKKLSSKAKNKTAPAERENKLAVDVCQNEMNFRANNNISNGCAISVDKFMEEECEAVEVDQNQSLGKRKAGKSITKPNKKPVRSDKVSGPINSKARPVREGRNQTKKEPMSFIFSGRRFQRKEFRQVIKSLKGRCCKDSHHWSYHATHFVVPDRVRRTEKFFAAAASGRWILKTDYLTACSKAGKFLPEEPYEWYNDCLCDGSSIYLEAPRKWRLLRERTGHGAFYGMQIVIYGVCIAPSLGTLKRVVKAGDGTILATSPPYTKFLKSEIDFFIVSPGMPAEDYWVQEFIKHEIPCVSVNYLVEYICKPGHPLDRHVLYKTDTLAKKSLANLEKKANVIAKEACTSSDDLDSDPQSDNIVCRVCGSCDWRR